MASLATVVCLLYSPLWSLLLLVNIRGSFHCKQSSLLEKSFYNFLSAYGNKIAPVTIVTRVMWRMYDDYCMALHASTFWSSLVTMNEQK